MTRKYTQEDKAIRVRTPLEDDVLLLDSISGTEGLSRPYVFQVNLLSERADIDPSEILRKPMAVWFKLENEIPTWDDEENRWVYEGGRWIHGLVRSFTQMGNDQDLYFYRAEIVPWIWFLSLEKNCRIFQRKREEEDEEEEQRNCALEIVEKIFREYEGKCEHAAFEIKCNLEYPERDYCVQYRESSLNFVSRLLEEEGIYYYFEHSEHGHRLVLVDDIQTLPVCEGQPQVGMNRESGRENRRSEDNEGVVKSLEREYSVHSGLVTIADYNYLSPGFQLLTSANEVVNAGNFEEAYDYPGGFDEKFAKDSEDPGEEPPIPQRGEHLVRIGIEREEATRRIARGSGNCRAFYAGACFHLTGHGDENANCEYALLEIRHEGSAGTYRTGRAARGDKPTYQNTFQAMPRDVQFRPPVRSPKPLIHGSQTAVVVGPSGEEIFVDAHGRIKVQFHWDRLGRKNAGSSCWLRVSTPWAGKSWGAIEIPRMGQEVVVSFMEGDPDRPLVTGSVYNGEHAPPWTLPEEKTRSGVKSDTHKGSGYNEISFDDKEGEEQIRVHAQKDMSTTVLNDRTTSVGNDQKTTVQNSQTIEVIDGHRKIAVGGRIDEEAGEDICLKSDVAISLQAQTFLHATAKEDNATWRSIDAKAELVGKTEALVDGHEKARLISGGGPVEVEAKTRVDIGANDQIELKVGGAKVTITSDSITLEAAGNKVELSNGGIVIDAKPKDVTVSGGSVKLNC